MNDTPMAGRLRRPGWKDPRLLIGLLLVALSVTAVTAMVRGADVTSPYYAAKDTLTPGTVLTRDDVMVVHVRTSSSAYLGAGDEPWGRVVTRVVGEGELVPSGALAEPASYDGRTVAVRTTLPLADGVRDGSIVDVYLTREGDDGEPETERVAEGLVVESVDHDGGSFSSGSVETVYVVVPSDAIEPLLDALAARGEISVVGMAGGGA